MARSIVHGVPVAPGIAIGRALFTHHTYVVEEYFIQPEDADAEVARLLKAAEVVKDDLTHARDAAPKHMPMYRETIDTHCMICQDPRLLKEAEDRIRTQRLCAPWALAKTVDALAGAFRDLDDPYLRERAQDIRAVGLRLQARLKGKRYTPQSGACPSVYIAEVLSPADVLDLPTERLLALVTSEGGPTAHTAIVARSLRVPTVMGATGIMDGLREGDMVIVDALHGCIYVEPDQHEVNTFARAQEEYVLWTDNVRRSALLPAETQDAVSVRVQANLENVDELAHLPLCGACGVGLYRTEYAYLRSRQLPDEELLFAEYSAVARAVSPHRVVFRTLDVGADKMLHSHLALKEINPALGLRGIRFCLRHQDLFRTQLRALLRAGVYGDIALMLPMITGLEEVRAARRILHEVSQDLYRDAIPHAPNLPLGVMIEVPSAVFLADALARECDFFSMGTNDLIHYLLAIDRGNKHVGYLHAPLHPALLRSLKMVIDSARRHGIDVSVCGELVADPHCLAVLLGMGIHAVSATPHSVPGMKHCIRSLNVSHCVDIARAVLDTHDVATANSIVAKALSPHLGDSLAFHSTLIRPGMNPGHLGHNL